MAGCVGPYATPRESYMTPLRVKYDPSELTTSLVVVVAEVALLLHDTAIMNVQPNKEIPTYLTLKELAELLKVKPRTIYAWVSEKRIPFERKGGLLRFRLDAVVAWNEPAR